MTVGSTSMGTLGTIRPTGAIRVGLRLGEPGESRRYQHQNIGCIQKAHTIPVSLNIPKVLIFLTISRWRRGKKVC